MLFDSNSVIVFFADHNSVSVDKNYKGILLKVEMLIKGLEAEGSRSRKTNVTL